MRCTAKTPLSATLLLAAALILTVKPQAQSIPNPTEGAGYLPSPIAQPSIAGSAGPFEISSFSRTSSYTFDQGTAVPQTTTYQPPAASYASKSLAAGIFDTNSGSTVARTAAFGSSASSMGRASSSTSTSTSTSTAISNGSVTQSSSVKRGDLVIPVLLATAAALFGTGILL